MKKLKLLKTILKQTKADQVLLTYLLSIFGFALIIFLAEDSFSNYGDALWYCYEVISTIGFGEFTVVTLPARICSVLLTVYSLLVIAIITGVVTNYYIQLTQLRNNETVVNFIDKLENLPSMSKEELQQLSENVHKFRNR